MIFKFVIPTLSLVLASAPASAAQSNAGTPAAKPAAAAASSASAKADKICIKMAPMTGSRFEKLECKTRQQWERDGVNVDQLIK